MFFIVKTLTMFDHVILIIYKKSLLIIKIIYRFRLNNSHQSNAIDIKFVMVNNFKSYNH